MPNASRPNIDPEVLARARKAADRLRPSAKANQRGAANANVATSPQDVRALIDLVDALCTNLAPIRKISSDDEVTPNEAALILGMSRPSVMRLIAKGDLHPRMVHSRHKLLRAEVESLARSQTQERREAIANLSALSEAYDF